ncbi:MAG: PKD domain-containing protein [Verrucomicrobia bacterium]|nr:PKD domain-containing protein [Verrucomicrobiota bacterium]
MDVFSFVTGAGNVSLTAKAAAPSSGNLNLLFSLYDSNGTTITTAGPSAADTGVSINSNLAAGTYYLAINGVGSGDPLTTGFSNYDCIGQFSISGSVVPGNNQAPTAVASNSAPLTGYAPLAVNFSSVGSSDPDGTVASYSWNFGDGTALSTLANPAHSYAAAGTFNATLVVKDNYGVASAPASVTVTVQAAPVNQVPVAVASSSAPLTGYAPLTVNFSSAGSSDSDGTIASYAWLFGDGTVSTSANPAHTYTNVGTYTATLTVTDNQGATSAPVNVTITVQPPPANQAPIAVASATPQNKFVALAVNFSSAGSSDPDGTIASYSWNFGDGTALSTLANPAHSYTTAGTYTATLTVKDNQGLASTPVSLIIIVKPKSVYVANLTIIKTSSSKGTFATASITVKDHTGALKANATVNGKWTGLTSSTGGVKTASNGVAISKSATTKTAVNKPLPPSKPSKPSPNGIPLPRLARWQETLG